MLKEKLGYYFKNRYEYTILLTLFLLNLIYNYVWITSDKNPPSWDPSAHLMLSLSYYNILVNPGWDMIGRIIQVSSYYPPFYHFFTSVMYLFFGTSLTVAMMVNSIFLGILVFAVFGIGKKIFNKETGFIAAILVFLYPSVFSFQKMYMLELPLIAMTALSIYFLLLTDHFKNLKYSIAFGVAAAMATLTKWTAVIFLFGPLLCVVHDAFSTVSLEQRITTAISNLQKRKKDDVCQYCGKTLQSGYLHYANKKFCSKNCKKKWNVENKQREVTGYDTSRIRNLFIGISVSIFLASVWYIPHLSDVYNNVILGQTAAGAAEGDPSILTISSISYYIFSIVNFPASPILSILLFIGIIEVFYLARSNNNNNNLTLLMLWILIPYLTFTLFRNKDPRYILPVLGAVAIISALSISKIRNSKIKAVVFSIVLIFGGMQFLGGLGLYGVADAANSISTATNMKIGDYGSISLFPRISSPSREDWKIVETLDTINKDASKNPRTQGRLAIVVVLPDYNTVNGYTFSYYAASTQLPLYIINAAYLPSPSVFYDNFLNIDYIVSKTGDIVAGDKYRVVVNDMNNYFEENYNGTYQLIQDYGLPDNSTLSVYKNIRV